VAFEGFNPGTGLYPAASLSQRQKVQFNFGKTPMKHLPPGYQPFWVPISEKDKQNLIKLFEKYQCTIS
jgi:hypothetical protein